MTDTAATSDLSEVRIRRPGRPKGTTYRAADRPKHEEMRHLIESGQAHCLTAAAKLIVDREGAYGIGAPQSKIARLVRTYPW